MKLNTEIASRARAQRTKERSLASTASLQSGTSQITLSVDGEGQVEEVRPAAGATLGFRHIEMVGMWLSELLHPDDVATLGLSRGAAPERRTIDNVRAITREGAIVSASMARHPRPGGDAPMRVELWV